MNDQDIEELTESIQSCLAVCKEMSEKLIEHRGHMAAIELSIIAIAEQLAASGTINGKQASNRMLELSKAIEPPAFLEKIGKHIDARALRLRQLQGPEGPRPPRGSRPKLVQD